MLNQSAPTARSQRCKADSQAQNETHVPKQQTLRRQMLDLNAQKTGMSG
jgi:hypothetical protein